MQPFFWYSYPFSLLPQFSVIFLKVFSTMDSTPSANINPIYNLPDLKLATNDDVAISIYEIVINVNAHIPVLKQESVSFLFCCVLICC
jgi:hypothetical protein